MHCPILYKSQPMEVSAQYSSDYCIHLEEDDDEYGILTQSNG